MRLRYLPLLLCGWLAPAFAQDPAEEPTSAKRAAIERLMDITGSAKIAGQFARVATQQVFQALRRMRPDIPDGAVAIIEPELTAVFSENLAVPGGLIDMGVPVLHRHFSHAGINGLIAFHETPLGSKTLEVLPRVLQESIRRG
jgi:hypothetical protein